MQDETICVIGVSGFIGQNVAGELLRRGYSVKGTLRDPEWPDDEERNRPTGYALTRQNTLGVSVRGLDEILEGVASQIR